MCVRTIMVLFPSGWLDKLKFQLLVCLFVLTFEILVIGYHDVEIYILLAFSVSLKLIKII